MSARKSLPGGSSRYSRFSIQSQVSGVLNPDSNVSSDDEGNPLWHKNFEYNSIRQSARFSVAQSDTPTLDPNSEPESTPLEKDWWKNVENTPYATSARSKASRERSSVQERSIVESSDTSSLHEGVRKQRLAFRRGKRKSVAKNVFSEILDSSKDSISAENVFGNKSTDQKQDTIISQSDTDISVEATRKQPFKKKRKIQLVKQPFHIESNSDESVQDEFQDALDGLQSHNESGHQDAAANEAASSLGNQEENIPVSPDNAETVSRQLEHALPEKRIIAANESAGVSIEGDDMERSRSPVLMSRPKTRTIFAKRMKRKTMNFDDLLNDTSESERVADQSSIRGNSEINRNKRSKQSVDQSSQELDLSSHILAQDDESDSESGIVRQRVPFTYKKRNNQQEKSFINLFTSPNTSVRSEPINAGKETGEVNLPRQEIPLSDVEKRSSKRISNFAEVNQSARKLNRSSSSANKSRDLRRSTNKKNDHEITSQHSNIELGNNEPPRLSSVSNKSGVQRRSMRKKNDRTEISDHSDVELEDNQAESPQARPSSVGNKSGTERRSINKKNDRTEISDHSDVELEDNPAESPQTRPSSVGNKSGTERRSTNKKKDRGEISGPLIVELQEDRAVNIPIGPLSRENKSGAERRSMNRTKDSLEASSSSNAGYFMKLRAPNRNRISSNDSQVNKKRSSTQAKNTSLEVHENSTNEEEEDEEADSTDTEDLPSSSRVIEPQNQTQRNQEEHSNESRSNARDASSANMRTTILMDLANRSADRKETESSKKSGSTVARNIGKRSSALQENNREMASDKNGSLAADRQLNTEIDDSVFTGVETLRSFPSPGHDGTRSMAADVSSRIESQSLNAEKLSQLKIQLEEVKKNDLVRMKNTQIDSYFKKVSTNKTTDAVSVSKDSQKVLKKKKPVENQNKTSLNKAYLVNGKVYKRPKLPRPKSWATDRLYNFLWKKLEPKYKLKTRVRSEKFVLNLSQAVTIIIRRQKYNNYKAELEELIHEMARLGIIKTRNDFHIFCRDFLNYDFRIKVIPMLLPGNVRNIPFNPDTLHTPILQL